MIEMSARDEFDDLRAGVRALCEHYPGEYWRGLEPDGYPEAFVDALTKAGWLAALIPEEYGGGGVSLAQAAAILEEISASGANPAACHAQMYVMGTLLRHGSEAQKQHFLPKIAAGELRLQAFGVTEPVAGSETTRIRTRADKTAEGWVINGQKIWTSRAMHSDLMILLARTTAYDEVTKKSDGISVFIVDMHSPGIEIRPIPTMMNHNTTEVFFTDVVIPHDALIGEEGKGFKYILDGMNAERILIASECIGDGRFFLEKAVAYGNERVVFGRGCSSPSPRPTHNCARLISCALKQRIVSIAVKPAVPKPTWPSCWLQKLHGLPGMPVSTPTVALASPRSTT